MKTEMKVKQRDVVRLNDSKIVIKQLQMNGIHSRHSQLPHKLLPNRPQGAVHLVVYYRYALFTVYRCWSITGGSLVHAEAIVQILPDISLPLSAPP